MTLTFRRITNLLRAEMSFALSHFGIVRVRHLPAFVSVEPAAVCQLHCPECPVGQANHQSTIKRSVTINQSTILSLPLFERILAEIAPTAHTMQFYFQGEPLLNRDLPVMIRRAHDSGLYTIVSTNAQALTRELANRLVEAGLSRIIVSIDGFSEESYEAYRQGGSLERALAGLRALYDAKQALTARHLTIVLQVLRLRTNEHEWPWIAQHYRELGADRLEFKTAQLYDYEQGHPLMPTDERYSRYRKGKDNRYHLKRNKTLLFSPCHRLWTGCVVTTRGEVLPCCYDKASAHSYGNIQQQSMRELFQGPRAHALRRVVLRTSSRLDICHNCVQ